jgi:hypothetical protein
MLTSIEINRKQAQDDGQFAHIIGRWDFSANIFRLLLNDLLGI